jgi:chromosome segregation ATPase
LEAIRKVVQQHEGEIKVIELKILEIGGPKMKVQKARVDQLSNAITASEEEITKAKVAIKAAERAIDKSQKKFSKDSQDRQANKDNIESIQQELKTMEGDAQSVLEGFKQASVVLEQKQQQMTAIKAQHDEVRAQVTKMQSQEVDLDQQLEDQTRQLTDAQTKVKVCEKKLAGLELHKVSNEALGHALAPDCSTHIRILDFN